MSFSACAALLAIPCWIALLFGDSRLLLLFANFVLLALSLIWLGPAAADVHEIAGPKLRGLGIGIYFFAVNIAAYAIGAPLVGLLNDRLGATRNPAGLRYALLISPFACAISAILLWRGSKKLREAETMI
jgi:MFS family permease